MSSKTGHLLDEAIQAGLRRDYAGAVELLLRLIFGQDRSGQDRPGGDPPPAAWLYLGRALHALGDYGRAIAAFDNYMGLKPRSASGYRFAGRSYLARAMPRRAIPLLEKALLLNPADTAAMALLGAAYLKARRSGAAAEMLGRAVEAAAGLGPGAALPEGEQRRIYRAYLNSLLIRGIKLCRAGNYGAGGAMLSFVAENGAGELRGAPLLYLELGRAAREQGRLAEAADHYSKALDYAPEDPRIRWYRASLLMALGRDDEAREDIRRIRAAGDPLPDLPWNAALVDRFMIRSFLDRGAWQEAADAAAAWLKNRGDDEGGPAAIHAMYAEALRNLGRYRQALNHLERALELEGGEIRLWYALARTSLEGGDWTLLKKALHRLKEMGGDGETLRRFSLLMNINSLPQAAEADGPGNRAAIELLQNGIRALGPDAELFYALAERCLAVGLIEESLRWFGKAAEMEDRHEKARLGIIAAWEALHAEGEAGAGEALAGAYRAYRERWPDNLKLRREGALFLTRCGRFAEAAPELEDLLAWEPGNPSLRRLLAYVYRKTRRYREAALFLKALLKEKPADAELLLEYTGCLSRAGAPDRARMVLEKALDLGIFPPGAALEIRISLGILRFRARDPEGAFDLFREAGAEAPGDPRPYRWMAELAKSAGDGDGESRYRREALRRERGY